MKSDQQKKPKWWKSNYNLQEKIEFFIYRLAHPKEHVYRPLKSMLQPGRHLFTDEPADYSIAFIGDVMPINGLALSLDNRLAELLATVDLLVVNLEGIVTKDRRFLALSHDPDMLQKIRSLTDRTIILNLANNHSSDFGVSGFLRQNERLKEAGFPLLGFDDQRYRVADKFELHASSHWSNQAIDTSHRFVVTDTPEPPATGDQLYHIYMPHWGYEMELFPRSEQVMYAHSALGVGWDAIIGSHPHVPQPIEIVAGKPIVYSLGNFCYNNVNPNHRYGRVVKLSFSTKPSQKPSLVALEHHFTLQQFFPDRVKIVMTDILDYRTLRKQTPRNQDYYRDLLK